MSKHQGVRNSKKSEHRFQENSEYGAFIYAHSRSYHKYFRGYQETKVTGKSGREVIQRIYVADWYILDEPKRAWILRKFFYSIIYILSLAVFLAGLLQNTLSNYSLIVAFPGLISAFALFLALAAVMLYLITPRKMTIHEHESSTRNLKFAALISSVVILLTAAAKVIFVLIFLAGNFIHEIAGPIFLLISALLQFLIYLTERRAKYRLVPNEAFDDLSSSDS